MTPRVRWLCWAIVAIGVPLLFWSGPDFYSSRLVKTIWDFGHLLLFSALAMLCVRGISGRLPWSVAAIELSVFCLLVAAGAVVELIQLTLPGRSASAHDVLGDAFGVLIGLVWMRRGQAGQIWRISALVALALCYLPAPLTVFFDEALQHQQFPVLAEFDWPSEVTRFEPSARIRRITADQPNGGALAEIQLVPGQYAGFSLDHFPADWRAYRSFTFSLWLPEPRLVVVRVHDAEHERGDQALDDRFNQRLELTAGWHRLRFSLEAIRNGPQHRALDLSQVRAVGVFTIDLKQAETWRVDHFELDAAVN